jgi:hypothetical protein
VYVYSRSDLYSSRKKERAGVTCIRSYLTSIAEYYLYVTVTIFFLKKSDFRHVNVDRFIKQLKLATEETVK